MDGFNFVMPYQVRISDINYGNHVANSAVLNFFQDGRIQYLSNLGAFSELDIGGCGIILPEAQVKYQAEMFYADSLEIGVRIVELGRSSISMEYRIERAGQVTASGSTTLIAFDYTAHKPRRLPSEFKAAVNSFEGLE
ncbi:MAG: thioesterase family protein [Desulfuromonas sp.]|nr:thioesterase family protein [Desulfuromonas sp.]